MTKIGERKFSAFIGFEELELSILKIKFNNLRVS